MTTNEPQWSGEMLDRPDKVSLFAAQMRSMIGYYADLVARVRRDAEAMWAANPPEGYNTFEAWYRERWVKGPLADIQEHLEEAVKATFELEARYRKGRHEMPEARKAKRAAKAARKATPQVTARPQQQELGGGGFGRRTAPAPPAASTRFIDVVKHSDSRSA